MPEEVSAGDGPAYTLRHLFPTAADANATAQGKKKTLTHQKKKLSGTISGDTGVMAGAPLSVMGTGELYDGAYTIKTVEHFMEKRAGYRSRIKAETAGSAA